MKLGKHNSIAKALVAVDKPKMITKKLQMNIDESLHRRFKIACLKQDKEMTEITTQLIEEWLNKIE